MKCQSLFSGKNKRNIISLSPAESAQRVVTVNGSICLVIFELNFSTLSANSSALSVLILSADDKLFFFFLFFQKVSIFHEM